MVPFAHPRQLWPLWLALLLLIACGTPSPAVVATASVAPTAVGGMMKPLMTGLVDMGYINFNHTYSLLPDNSLTAIANFPGTFRGKVINVTWAQLQPSAGAFDPTVIDQALSAITAYNQAHPSAPLLVKLRVWGAGHSPDWAKHIGGPITVTFKDTTEAAVTTTVGAFWSPAYVQAEAHLQSLLAARYDANPLLATVVATSCVTQTDEPFNLAHDASTAPNLLAAGFTDAAYKDCLLHETDTFSAWKATRIETTYNPYHLLAGGDDTTITVQAMQACRTALGARCILSNHCLGRCDQTPLGDIYAAMKMLGAPIALQTAAPMFLTKDPANWLAVLQRAVGYGAASVELWPMGFTLLSQASVQQLAQLFPTH